MKTVGILGGGQLGAMLGESLFLLGVRPLFFAHAGSTAHQRFVDVTVGDFHDEDAVRRFVEKCDVVTFEMEHVPIHVLERIEANYCPSLDVIRLTQHRAREKNFLRQTGLPHALFEVLPTAEALAQLDVFPRIVKTSLGGYEGLGQRFIDGIPSRDQMVHDVHDAHGEGFVAEEPIVIEAELSCIIARDSQGRISEFPVFRNTHRAHVLDVTVVPTGLPDSLEREARKIAVKAAHELNVVGLLTTEFFVTQSPCAGPSVEVDGHHLLINEFAPRPHNSGHVTRKACSFSQFDALARILADIPLFPPNVWPGGFAMANLLSEIWGDSTELDMRSWNQHPDVEEVCLYGKSPSRPKRKMGHVICSAPSAAAAEHNARAFRDSLHGL